MAVGFGDEYAKKLSSRGFTQGRIIDVGCGSGATNLVLAERFPRAEIVGIDLSDPLLRLAREATANTSFGDRVAFERADVQQIPYDDDSFDVAISTNMVHIVEHPLRMLGEIERILAPDGHLFIVDLRRSLLGLLEAEIKSALSMGEAKDLLGQSSLRKGTFRWSLLWWRYEA
ncbi:MAG: methyltransferase domain-containing protein [Anaerolineae bacterium]|nr:methyltransferase domain-containing protein [Anaerolineae bacterium]